MNAPNISAAINGHLDKVIGPEEPGVDQTHWIPQTELERQLSEEPVFLVEPKPVPVGPSIRAIDALPALVASLKELIARRDDAAMRYPAETRHLVRDGRDGRYARAREALVKAGEL